MPPKLFREETTLLVSRCPPVGSSGALTPERSQAAHKERHAISGAGGEEKISLLLPLE